MSPRQNNTAFTDDTKTWRPRPHGDNPHVFPTQSTGLQQRARGPTNENTYDMLQTRASFTISSMINYGDSDDVPL
eukprot:5652905-Amphidinium_carterae.1